MSSTLPITKDSGVIVGSDGRGQLRSGFIQFSQATAERNRAEAQHRTAYSRDGFVAYRTITW